mmetsp:Transcript_46932/g.101070  ORF Transcript_46932/g.101070 Transcript_46932/m.101070 type:complete len:231 (+) Transcript_46932:226-918(+)
MGHEQEPVLRWGQRGRSLRDFRLRLEQDFGLEEGMLEGMKEQIAELLMEQMQQDAAAAAEASEAEAPAPRASRKRRSGTSWMHRGKKRRASKPAVQDLKAEDISVEIAGTTIDLNMRDSASGTRGYFACQEVPLSANGKRYALQCLVQCVAVEVFDPLEERAEEAQDEGDDDQDQDQDQDEDRDQDQDQEDRPEAEAKADAVAEPQSHQGQDKDEDQEAADDSEQTPDLN